MAGILENHRFEIRLRRVGACCALALLVLLFLPSTAGGGTPWNAPIASPLDRPAGVVSLLPHTVAPGFVPPAGAVPLGPLPSNTPLLVFVGLNSPNLAALEARITLEYTPGSAVYHQYLTPAELARQFGTSPAVYAQGVDYFTQRGLIVQPSPDRLFLSVSGPAATVGSAFGTSFDQFRIGDRVVFSHTTAATLPAGIPWSGALGLGNVSIMQPVGVPSSPSEGPRTVSCGGSTCLAPSDVHKAYNESSLLGSGVNGSGKTIAVVDTYDSGEPQAQLASDLGVFDLRFGLPAGNVRYVYPVPTAVNLNTTGSSGWGVEESLDLEWARAMAPGATIDMTFSPDPSAGLYVADDWIVSHHAADVISMSWGESDVGIFNAYSTPCFSSCNASTDGSYALLTPVLAEAAAEGISAFAASGDCGSSDGTSGLSTDFPSSDPYVTGVGATALTLNSTGGYGSETAWDGNSSGAFSPGCHNQGGSGGGFAPFPRPPWQSGNGLNGTPPFRGAPDVAIVGAGSTPVAIYVGGGWGGVAGTSVSTPIWAGIAAAGGQYAHGALGFLDPAIYAILRGPEYGTAFHDITSGNNGYSAGVGWDPITGVGTPVVSALLPLLANQSGWSSPTGLLAGLHATERFGPSPLTVTFTTTATLNGTPISPPFTDIYFGDGNASFAPSGGAAHVYWAPGAYFAQATVVASSGATAVSPPVVIDVGGGGLAVNLSTNATSPSIGAPVAFTTTVNGGVGPYTYTYEFGDGTYLNSTPNAVTDHAFRTLGGYCAVVAVRDSAHPASGESSNPVGIAVGGARAPACSASLSMSVSASAIRGTADTGQSVTFSGRVVGGAGGYSYNWTGIPLTGCAGATTATLNCSSIPAGNWTIQLMVVDSEGNLGASRPFAFAVLTDPVVSVPVASAGPVDIGANVTFTVTAIGGSGGLGLVWSGLPTGCANSGTNVVSCRPAAIGTFTVTVKGTDSNGYSVVSDALSFVVDATPVVTLAGSVPSVDVGQTVTFSASGSGGSGTYAYSWSGLPAGCASTGSKTVACQPTGSGNSTVIVAVTDGQGGMAISSGLPVAVYADPVVLSFGAVPSMVTAGAPTNLTVDAALGEGPLSYEYSGLPTGCGSENASTLACVPNEAGSFTVGVTVTDANGFVVRSTTELTVDAGSGGGSGSSPALSTENLEIAGALAAILVAAGVGALLVIRRKKP